MENRSWDLFTCLRKKQKGLLRHQAPWGKDTPEIGTAMTGNTLFPAPRTDLDLQSENEKVEDLPRFG